MENILNILSDFIVHLKIYDDNYTFDNIFHIFTSSKYIILL